MAMIFQKLMTKKTDAELEDYLLNIMTYSREIVEAAITELKNRGRVFTEDELTTLETKIQERENTIGKNTITAREPLERNIVEDESAVSLYSRKSIDWLTFAFGPLFGSILLTINLINIKKKKGIILVLLFGLIYLCAENYILYYVIDGNFPFKNSLRYLFNIVGAFILHTIFWNLLIGKEIKYRKKPILIPLIIGVVIYLIIFIRIFQQ
jgi:hypothetical protein